MLNIVARGDSEPISKHLIALFSSMLFHQQYVIFFKDLLKRVQTFRILKNIHNLAKIVLSFIIIAAPVYVTNTTKGTCCLLLRKLRFVHYLTDELTSFPYDTKFINIEVILLKIQVLQSVNFHLFSLYFTHCFAHYLRINLADIMSLLLYWVMTYMHTN